MTKEFESMVCASFFFFYEWVVGLVLLLGIILFFCRLAGAPGFRAGVVFSSYSSVIIL